jgi:hypothetical protein
MQAAGSTTTCWSTTGSRRQSCEQSRALRAPFLIGAASALEERDSGHPVLVMHCPDSPLRVWSNSKPRNRLYVNE